jgi:uncharacterized protein (UPF0261 family)
MEKTVLLIATLDTKEEEALFLKRCILGEGVPVSMMDVGILSPPRQRAELSQEEVAFRGGIPLTEARAMGDKALCTLNMIRGAEALTRELYRDGRIHGVVAIGGGQGTEIACTAMRALPMGVPALMVSTIANGLHTFGAYVGTKDLTMMHSVADLQGLNFVTRQILQNAAHARRGSGGALHAGDDHGGSSPREEKPGGPGVRGGGVSPERNRRHRHGGHDSRRLL